MSYIKSLKSFLKSICTVALLSILAFALLSSRANAVAVGEPCDDFRGNTLLGIPAWYKYLPGEGVQQIKADGSLGDVICQPTIQTVTTTRGEKEKIPINNILLIVAAIIEILIRLAGLAAFVFLIYGGFMYLTSSGNADNISKAGSTLLNAAIGLGIAVSATAFINFFAGRFKGS